MAALTRAEAAVVDAVRDGARTADEIAAVIGSHPAYVRDLVIRLEYAGLIRRANDGRVRWQAVPE